MVTCWCQKRVKQFKDAAPVYIRVELLVHRAFFVQARCSHWQKCS